MIEKKVKLRGPKYISEMLIYRCPFTEESKLMHPNTWPSYVRERAKGKTLEELTIAYRAAEDSITKDLLEKTMLNYHDSIEH